MKMSRARRVLIVLVVLLLLGVYVYRRLHRETQKLVSEIDPSPISLADVADGEYLGSSEKGPVKVQVRVIVKDQKIEKIDLLRHDRALGGKAEQIIDRIVEGNSLEVDAISGATLSSEVIKDAIRQALKQGLGN